MKRFSLVAAAAFIALTACSSPAAETATQKRTIEDGGTGPAKAIMVEEPSLEAHTIFRPEDLSKFGKKNPLPVLVWGNGACSNSPWEHVKFLSEVASHGYIVIATGYFPADDSRYVGPMSTSAQQIEGIDWAFLANEDKNSPYYGKLDTDNIALAGMSCGGLQTLDNATDPRVKCLMICNSGLFSDPAGAVPGMPMPDKSRLQEILVPIMYLLGGETDIAYLNGMDDFSRIDHVPAVAVNYPVGHGGTYAQEHGGEFSIAATAWLDWQLKGDAGAAAMFKGSPAGIEARPDWTIAKKNID
ncbi:MAG: alpha/beta hydrolase [Bacteroidales bacterium]|nr:alpha/beta hydrolase [Bacteroidales bacterium]